MQRKRPSPAKSGFDEFRSSLESAEGQFLTANVTNVTKNFHLLRQFYEDCRDDEKVAALLMQLLCGHKLNILNKMGSRCNHQLITFYRDILMS